MWKALIPFLLQILLSPNVSGNGTYECGNHGRFEYCIDEIPGCVIGCHCHPGYYFDTNTKICEPNTRLIEQHRRNNVLKPDGAQKIDVTPSVIYATKPAPNTNKIDGHVDVITKDANDLGDWLYNQFFKTIENQVINNTNDKDISTRRHASQKSTAKSKRTKKWRKREKFLSNKGTKEQLRRKLLRITENDSLFDISSKSSSDSSDSSSSADLSSMEYDVNERNHHKHDDNEHGHKKIVMINKKPKKSLPSFIFLPNLDTPFYPPMGLPAPPIVPMYPMVPVPPVPLWPISGGGENAITTTVTTNNIVSTTTAATTTVQPTLINNAPIIPENSPVTEATTDDNSTIEMPKTNTKVLRQKHKKVNAPKLLYRDGTDAEKGSNNLKPIDRQRFLTRFKEKDNSPSTKQHLPSLNRNEKIFVNKYVNQNGDIETKFLDKELVDYGYLNNEVNPKPLEDDATFSNNVDFKYITELIHRVDQNNKSNDLPPIVNNPLDNAALYRSPKTFSDYSANFDTLDGQRLHRPIYHKSDESYYASLGRQIATMIRGVNSQENVEMKETLNKIKSDPYVNRNLPTSFWERSVRSPLAYLNTKNHKFEYLKSGNELLFDIENKVEIIASTAPSLTLQEIENIVKVMEVAQKEMQIKNKPNAGNLRVSKKNLNINLWPQNSHNSMISYKNSMSSYTNRLGEETNLSSYNTYSNKFEKPYDNLSGVRMNNIQKFVAWNGVNRNLEPINQTIDRTAKPSIRNDYFKIPTYYNLGKVNKTNQITARIFPIAQSTIRPSFFNEKIHPYFSRHRKYFQDSYYNYANPNEKLTHYTSALRIGGGQPTYFPGISHFHFME